MVASRASLLAACCVSKSGVAERVARAADRLAGSGAQQVPRLPDDACEKDWRHGDQQQSSIELHGVFLPGPWPLAWFAAGGVVIVRASRRHLGARLVRCAGAVLVHPTLPDSVHV
jgi:hypothetical protein